MSGGKSSSESSSSNSTTTSAATSTGTVGDVIQGQTITINDNLPEPAYAVFEQLVALAGQAITTAAAVGNNALDTVAGNAKDNLAMTNALAQATKQPDLTVLQGSQKQIYYAIGAVALVAVVLLFRKS